MDPIVSVDGGRISGVATEHGWAFLGVPYAAPPFGRHRLQAPAPVEPWRGVRRADRHAPTAPQPATGFTLIPEPTIEGGKAPACLSLNVFTPDPGAGGLPVLAWIHGGGYTTGTPSSVWYDGRRFSRDGVVVVSIGYRLGAEGFAPIEGAPHNRGVLDWIAALEWIQRNITGFGGDPGRVTVAGQSAGGGAALLLSTLPRADGLFHQVLAMSGVPTTPPLERAVEAGDALASALRSARRHDAIAKRTPARVVAAQTEIAGAWQGMPFLPYVDGELVTRPPIEAVAAGASAHRPMLLGATAEELNVTNAYTELADEQLERRLRRMGLDDAGIAAHRAAVPGAGNGVLFGQALTDTMFRRPAQRVAELRAEQGAPVFHYEFTWRSPALGGLGACHCLDLPFAWDLLDADHVATVLGDEPPQALADAMHRAWVDFVTGGDAGWSPYDLTDRSTMVFDEVPKLVADHHEDLRARWAFHDAPTR